MRRSSGTVLDGGQAVWQGAMHARRHADERKGKMELISGTAAAKQAGIHQATWGRWVAEGKAPSPLFERDNFKLYLQTDVTKFLDGRKINEEE